MGTRANESYHLSTTNSLSTNNMCHNKGHFICPVVSRFGQPYT